jgi:hypothetical protein
MPHRSLAVSDRWSGNRTDASDSGAAFFPKELAGVEHIAD